MRSRTAVCKNGVHPKSKGVLLGHVIMAGQGCLSTDHEKSNCYSLVYTTMQPLKNVYNPYLTYFYPV